jgi:hypothetical protein
MTSNHLSENWRTTFWSIVQQPVHALTLKTAAMQEQLGDWTRALTAVAVETCTTLGWQAAAKGFPLDLLPESRHEYLGLDVMAFAAGETRWCFPVATLELENSRRDDRIAYSLWKVLCVRSELRLVFCYRREPDDGADLLRFLGREVISAVGVDQRLNLKGETIVVVGSRGEAATFPYGYFKWWQLNLNLGLFYLM